MLALFGQKRIVITTIRLNTNICKWPISAQMLLTSHRDVVGLP